MDYVWRREHYKELNRELDIIANIPLRRLKFVENFNIMLNNKRAKQIFTAEKHIKELMAG